MSASNLQVLQTHRDALLLAEVAAWLHMLGKFSAQFLNGDRNLAKDLPPDIEHTYNRLNHLLRNSWPDAIWAQLPLPNPQNTVLSIFEDFIKGHQEKNNPSSLANLFADAHGRGSGVEKGVLARFCPSQSKMVYLATAFGQETTPIDLQWLERRRRDLYTFLEQKLDALQNALIHKQPVDWTAFRAQFIRRIEENFRQSVAETRRPINDISLFDQTAASVAFFKAALAETLLTGHWKNPRGSDPGKRYRWRFLKVGLNGWVFWGQVARAVDMLSRKSMLAQALDWVRTLLEETYPLGMEIYRDENGSIFIVPDLEGLLQYRCDQNVSLEKYIQNIARKTFQDEASFTLDMSPATRHMLVFGRLAMAPVPAPLPFIEKIQPNWHNNLQRELCAVCGIRPQGPGEKALAQKVCDICEQRRHNRVKEWLSKKTQTIWIDEVADLNGRVALIVGHLDIAQWLSGEALSTVLMFEPSVRCVTDPERGNKTYHFDYSKFLKEISTVLNNAKQPIGKQVPTLDNLLLKHHRGDCNNQFPCIYDLYVKDTDLEHPQYQPEAWRFALALMRQQPSFARIRRVWETTQTFWQTVWDEKDAQSRSLLPTDYKRLIIEVAPESIQSRLSRFHAYELAVRERRLNVVWDGQNFITCDNLLYLEKLLQQSLKNYLRPGQSLDVYAPSDYGQPSVLLGSLVIQRIREDEVTFTPVIRFLEEPRVFMTLVPADKALVVAQAITQKYRRELGKVQNRLSLFLGMVFFPRKTPLMAVMDTARRMLNQVSLDKETWTISSVQDGHITFKNGITWTVPTQMGDGSPDVWYPYWQVEGKPTDRTHWFIGPQGEHWVHVSDLRPGDRVRVTPSRLAYLFLETTAQRFHFDPSRDVLLLDDLDAITKIWSNLKQSGISDTALQGLWHLLQIKAESWGIASPEFGHLTETVLKDAGLYRRKGTDGKPGTDWLTPAEVTSQKFFRSLELHLRILKLRLKEPQHEREPIEQAL